uniref:NADH-ubiquinone oxidoreductase chain 3 n=1 Tax=Metacrangonyx dhofarensis TaxID=2291046 RepID=A0A345UDK3_9CRUS|nr:NADH dehydrogenase subunit 3 [Metacrangonyx dhofarensis]
MYILNFLVIFTVLLSFLILFLAKVLGKKMVKERDKNSPFECGFDPFKKARSSFSVRFFLITIIFLIFDIEVVIILPIGIIMSYLFEPSFMLITLVVMFILVIGLFHEWNQGALNWVV